MAQTLHCPRHHAVEASALATSSSICMKTSSGASLPPVLCGSSERYSPFSIRAETTGSVSRRPRSISSASCAISGASARARSISPKPGSLFMRFLALFWGSWLVKAQWWSIWPDGSRWGDRHSGARSEPGISRFRVCAEPVIAPRFARTRWRIPNDRASTIRRHCASPSTAAGASLPGAPIISCLVPRIDGIVFGMLRHQLHLTADFREHLGIAQIRHPMLHQSQALRTQPFGLFPISGRQNLACGQDFDADNMSFGIDVVDERSGLLGPVNLAAADGDIHRVGFGIVGYVSHGFRLAFRSNIALITRMLEFVSTQATRSTRRSN